MRDTLEQLQAIRFPEVTRGELDTLQVNLGYRCNQQCQHCHVNAGPNRKEDLGEETFRALCEFISRSAVRVLDITGGAPELNQFFRPLVLHARSNGLDVIDRCNLSILFEPEQDDLGEFLASNQVRVVASLPCYLEENVDAQRGKGVFNASIEGLRLLNQLGYAKPDSGLQLDLVYNPIGAVLPPPQCALEADYKRELKQRYGIEFGQLLTLTNMPIARFGSMLLSKGEFDRYMGLLQEAHRVSNLDSLMCRSLISVDWQGYVYDCDFNQMLGLDLGGQRTHIDQLAGTELRDSRVTVAGHCFGCTAGQGSSCGGALDS